MSPLPATAQDLLRAQHACATRAQLLAHGVGDRAVRHRLDAGLWQRPLPAVVVAQSTPLTERQMRQAALLYAGEGALLTGSSAARLHGLRYAPAEPPVSVTVARQHRPTSRAFVAVSRTIRPDDGAMIRDGLPVVGVARAVADAALVSPWLRPVRALVCEAVQRGFTTPEALWAEYEAGPRRASAHLRRALLDVGMGARSAPEAEVADLVRESAVLPEPRLNVEIRDGGLLVAIVDLLLGERFVIEVDSVEYHAGVEVYARTMARHNKLTVLGYVVAHITPARLRASPASVLWELEQGYLASLR